MGWINSICAVPWLPLSLFLIECFHRRRNILYLAGTGAALGLMGLAGRPQTAFYGLLLVVPYFLCRRLAPTSRGEPGHRKLLGVIGGLGIMAIVAAGLAAVQLIPTAELTALSDRSEGAEAYASASVALDGRSLHLLLFPITRSSQIEGPAGERVAYMGLLPPLLAIVALTSLVSRRRGIVLFFGGAAALALILAFGPATPLYGLVRGLPPLRYFRTPARFLYIYTFAVAVLAGRGLDALLGGGGRGKAAARWFLALLVLCDIGLYGTRILPLVDRPLFETEPAVRRWLADEPGLFRYYALAVPPVAVPELPAPDERKAAYLAKREGLSANLGAVFGLQHLSGYGAFLPRRTKRFLLSLTPSTLSLANCRYILTPRRLRAKGLDLAKEAAGYRLYRNTGVLPRALIFSRAKRLPGGEAVLKVITSAEFDPLEDLLLEDPPDSPRRPAKGPHPPPAEKAGARGAVRLLRYRPCEVEIEADVEVPGYLFLADAGYPGWKATVRGETVRLFRANYLFRAVPLPAGKSAVLFRYEPRSFRIGLAISLISLVSLAGLFLLRLVAGRRRKPRDPACQNEPSP
jgi:hypothetical protein